MPVVSLSGLNMMCCSFAVVRFLSIFSLLILNVVDYSRAEKEFIFKKGNVYQRKWKLGGRCGIGWFTRDGATAVSCDKLCENWFYLSSMDVGTSNRVFLEIEYKSKKNCNESWCGLFIRTYKGNVAFTTKLTKEQFKESSHLPSSGERRIKTVYFDMELDKRYINFAIRAKGVCTVIYNISVYYYYCPRKALKFVTLNKTSAPSSGMTEVEGHCYRQSSDVKGVMVAHCNSNGTWENFSRQTNHCRCAAGEEFDNQTGQCSSCKQNHFKKSAETDSCIRCPANLISPTGAIECKCPKNLYNNDKELLCRSLPPKPVNLNYSKGQDNEIQLSWEIASNVSRKDISFMVKCKQCVKSSTNCNPCEGLSIGKEDTNLTETNLTVRDLKSNTLYKFEVTSLNGLCNEANRNKWQTAMVSVKISGETVETKTTLNKIDSSVSSTVPPGDTETLPGGTPKKVAVTESDDEGAVMTPLTGVAIAIAALAIILLIIGIIIYKSRRRQKEIFDEEIPLAPFEKSYVDPAKFGNSEKAVRKFAKEIDRRQVKLEGIIGEGEFARVHKGSLCRPNEPAIPVAVKVLKPGSSAKNREDFLTEAAVMGQFKDMNIVALEGVVTISHPVMIITEFMHNGALSTYLAENKNRLIESQLLAMARGIASGMRYLARMRFVHRDLAARNVLVNENLVCKVADFGLTRELEESCQGEYVTQGGKIPIRWTAPEAYKHRRFTTASDVWSFGIVLWEIMSYAERPYGTWDNYMVMDQVNGNYRLTAPTNCPKIVHQLMTECWKADRSQRPAFADIVDMLERWIKNPYLLKDYEYVTEKTRMVDRKSCVAKSIREHLEGIKMERYIEKFIDYGYTELYQIEHLNDGDLVCLGVPLVGHRNKIMKSLSLRSDSERLLPTDV